MDPGGLYWNSKGNNVKKCIFDGLLIKVAQFTIFGLKCECLNLENFVDGFYNYWISRTPSSIVGFRYGYTFYSFFYVCLYLSCNASITLYVS